MSIIEKISATAAIAAMTNLTAPGIKHPTTAQAKKIIQEVNKGLFEKVFTVASPFGKNRHFASKMNKIHLF